MDKQKTRLALRQVLFLQFTWRQIQVRLSIVVPIKPKICCRRLLLY